MGQYTFDTEIMDILSKKRTISDYLTNNIKPKQALNTLAAVAKIKFEDIQDLSCQTWFKNELHWLDFAYRTPLDYKTESFNYEIDKFDTQDDFLKFITTAYQVVESTLYGEHVENEFDS